MVLCDFTGWNVLDYFLESPLVLLPDELTMTTRLQGSSCTQSRNSLAHYLSIKPCGPFLLLCKGTVTYQQMQVSDHHLPECGQCQLGRTRKSSLLINTIKYDVSCALCILFLMFRACISYEGQLSYNIDKLDTSTESPTHILLYYWLRQQLYQSKFTNVYTNVMQRCKFAFTPENVLFAPLRALNGSEQKVNIHQC